jgi:hypothetical protein
MALLLLLPAVLSLLVLCGHLLREGMLLVIPLLFMLLPLLILPRGWVARLWQVVLFLGALEWVRTAVFLAIDRQEAGEPWIRMAVILGATAAFTFGSALLFEARPLLDAYPRVSMH